MKIFLKKVISFILAIIIMTIGIGTSYVCAEEHHVVSANEIGDTESINNIPISDSLVTLHIKGDEASGIDVDGINVDEIVVNSIQICYLLVYLFCFR